MFIIILANDPIVYFLSRMNILYGRIFKTIHTNVRVTFNVIISQYKMIQWIVYTFEICSTSESLSVKPFICKTQ